MSLGMQEIELWDETYKAIEPIQLALADHPVTCDRIRHCVTRLLRTAIELSKMRTMVRKMAVVRRYRPTSRQAPAKDSILCSSCLSQ
jgi:hypothetical protein